jgi:hypothetical protein
MAPTLVRRIARPPWIILAVLAALLMSGGVAFAYVTVAGSGSGSASTDTMQTVTVSALVGGDAPSSSLYPGGPAADVVLRVTNPNAFTVQVFSVAGNGTITADGAHAGCTTSGVTFMAPTNPNITLPSGASLVHLAGAAAMSTASMSTCQGATFSIPVTLTVHR